MMPIDPYDPRPRGTFLRLGVLLLFGLFVMVALGGVYAWNRWGGWQTPIQNLIEKDGLVPAWMRQKISYPQDPPQPPPPKPQERDLNAERLAQLAAMMQAMQLELDALKKRPVTTYKPPDPKPEPPKHAPMLFVQHELKEKAAAEPGTYPFSGFIPCQVETTLNSEIPGLFTVKTRTNLFDTVSGHHLLIPQARRVVAKDESAHLLFGNERIPTFALHLEMPDGSSLDLGDAPIMDQSGTNGLTGNVDNHVWRLVWTSIFIGGLRGGQQMLQAEIAQQSGATVVTGIASQGSQVAQQRLGRAQDTRPTITVDPGSLCNILVPKTLHLAAIAQR